MLAFLNGCICIRKLSLVCLLLFNNTFLILFILSSLCPIPLPDGADLIGNIEKVIAQSSFPVKTSRPIRRGHRLAVQFMRMRMIFQ